MLRSISWRPIIQICCSARCVRGRAHSSVMGVGASIMNSVAIHSSRQKNTAPRSDANLRP